MNTPEYRPTPSSAPPPSLPPPIPEDAEFARARAPQEYPHRGEKGSYYRKTPAGNRVYAPEGYVPPEPPAGQQAVAPAAPSASDTQPLSADWSASTPEQKDAAVLAVAESFRNPRRRTAHVVTIHEEKLVGQLRQQYPDMRPQEAHAHLQRMADAGKLTITFDGGMGGQLLPNFIDIRLPPSSSLRSSEGPTQPVTPAAPDRHRQAHDALRQIVGPELDAHDLTDVEGLRALVRRVLATQPAPASGFARATPQARDAAVLGSAEKIRQANLRTGGIVTVPGLVDGVRQHFPDATPEEVHQYLQRMQQDDKLTLQLCNDPRFEPRADEGIKSPRGLLFYVQVREPQPVAPSPAPVAAVKPPPAPQQDVDRAHAHYEAIKAAIPNITVDEMRARAAGLAELPGPVLIALVDRLGYQKPSSQKAAVAKLLDNLTSLKIAYEQRKQIGTGSQQDVDRAVSQYQGIERDLRSITIEEARRRFADIAAQGKPLLAALAERIGFRPDGTKDELMGRLMGNLLTIKISHDQTAPIGRLG